MLTQKPRLIVKRLANLRDSDFPPATQRRMRLKGELNRLRLEAEELTKRLAAIRMAIRQREAGLAG